MSSDDIFDIFSEQFIEKEEQPEVKKEKEKTVFDYINQINKKTDSLKYNDKNCSSYILTLHYSHDNDLLKLVNEINPYIYALEGKFIYRYFFDKIPKYKKFIKWVKKDKIKDDKIKALMEKYDISYREAQESYI